MEQMSGILFICIALPMIPMLFILPDKKSRLFLGYMIVGATVCDNFGVALPKGTAGTSRWDDFW